MAFASDTLHGDLRLSASIGSEEKKGTIDLIIMVTFIHVEEEYIRVESLVDAHVWNVRVGPGATVADVCELLLKKIDAKYLSKLSQITNVIWSI